MFILLRFKRINNLVQNSWKVLNVVSKVNTHTEEIVKGNPEDNQQLKTVKKFIFHSKYYNVFKDDLCDYRDLLEKRKELKKKLSK